MWCIECGEYVGYGIILDEENVQCIECYNKNKRGERMRELKREIKTLTRYEKS